jgi:hypothetical protein
VVFAFAIFTIFTNNDIHDSNLNKERLSVLELTAVLVSAGDKCG